MADNPVVVEGEASESDDEQQVPQLQVQPSTPTPTPTQETGDVIVAGEASESEEEGEVITPAPHITINTTLLVDESRGPSGEISGHQPRTKDTASHVTLETIPQQHRTLLHRKLREATRGLQAAHVTTVQQTYTNGGKRLSSAAAQLIHSLASLQDTSQALRFLTNDLFRLQDLMDNVTKSSSIPDIDLSSLNAGASGNAGEA